MGKFKPSRTRATLFTEPALDRLKPEEKRFEVAEPGGLRIRVGKRSKAWCYRYKSPVTGKSRKYVFGSYPAMGISEARTRVTKAKEMISGGTDPQDVHLTAKKARKNEPTVAELIAMYLSQIPPTKRTKDQDARYLHSEIEPRWGNMKVSAVTRRDVKTFYDEKRGSGATVVAGRLLRYIKNLFQYAVEMEFTPANPAVDVKPVKGEQAKDRKRVLSNAEIQDLWPILCEQGKRGIQSRLALRMVLISGQRMIECCRCGWEHLDPEWQWWTIPGEYTKNGKTHRVPLTDFSRSLLREIKLQAAGSPFFFPGDEIGSPMGEKVPGMWLRRKHSKNLLFLEPGQDPGETAYAPHDLRRTVVTNLTSLGIDRLVADKIVNHTEKTVGAIYDRYSYDDEKRDGMERWHRRLSDIIEGRTNTLEKTLAGLRVQYDAGIVEAAFSAVQVCLESRQLPPEWALSTFLERWRDSSKGLILNKGITGR